MVEPTPEKSKGSRIISRVLPPAIRLWLQSQLDLVEDLGFQIEGRDRDILSGHIPTVALTAQKAIYRGIHLRQVAVSASGIRINLGQVLRRKPLRLLAPFPVSGGVCVPEADLNASLQSPLLGEGLYEFLRLIAKSQPKDHGLHALLLQLQQRTVLTHYTPSATIAANRITLQLLPLSGQTLAAIAISTHLVVKDGRRLCLEDPCWLSPDDVDAKTELSALQGFEIDLGSEVDITECAVQSQRLSIQGTLQVLPEVETAE